MLGTQLRGQVQQLLALFLQRDHFAAQHIHLALMQLDKGIVGF